MNRHRLGPIARCCLFALTLALLWPFAPDIACGCCPLLFMPPLFTTSPCPSYCSDPGPTDTSLTFSGITNLNCTTCTAFNTTILIPSPYSVLSGACNQQVTSATGAVPTNCQGGAVNAVNIKFQPDGSGHTQTRIDLIISSGSVSQTTHEYILVMDPSPMACNGITKTVPWSSTTPGAVQLCTASASNVTLVN